jgi:hypothetical protein
MGERKADSNKGFDEYFQGRDERLIDLGDNSYETAINTPPVLRNLNANLDYIKCSSKQVLPGSLGQEVIIRPVSEAAFGKLTTETRNRLGMVSFNEAGLARVFFEYMGRIGHRTRTIFVEKDDKRVCISWRNGRRGGFSSWQEELRDGNWSVVSEEGLSVEEALQISLLEKNLSATK